MSRLTVDRSRYTTRRQKRRREQYALAVNRHRTGPWLPREDAIALRDDIFLVEKVAILQRTACSIQARASALKRSRKTCKQCGQQFHPYTESSVYCSRTCFGQANTKIPPHFCEQCGVKFRTSNATRRFCSKKCADFASIQHPPRLCQQCGKVFKPRKATKYCSYRCHAESNVIYVARPCCFCGLNFKPRKESKYCSRECASRGRIEARNLRPCAHCGELFYMPDKRQKYCGRTCYQTDRQAQKTQKER